MITDIQKYSLHDGNGIRTTVFFKGCPLRCIWCHNPETQDFHKQMLYDRERCIECRQCEMSCPNHAIYYQNNKVITDSEKCGKCGTCLDFCAKNLRQIVGTDYTLEKLVEQLIKDEIFYEQSGGGVTLSGGEVMVQDMNYIQSLVTQLYQHGIRVNIDTCGFTQYVNFRRILPYVDTFLYDIKVLNKEKHVKYIGSDNALILENLIKLSNAGARIIIRIPMILEVNATNRDMDEMILWLLTNKIQVRQIHLLPYHNTGSHKYDKLGELYRGSSLSSPSEEQMQEFVNQFKYAGFHSIKIVG